MNYSIAMIAEVDEQLRRHLARADGQEDLCFGLWRPSDGRSRRTALLHRILLPGERERRVHGNASFQPAFFERALRAAAEEPCGLAFLHSHPAAGWQDMSPDDVRAERDRLAPAACSSTGLPLVGLTLAARDGFWSGRVWQRTGPHHFERTWAESVRVAGGTLRVHFCDQVRKPPVHRASQVRTVSAWGPKVQADLARVKVGIAGLGSVGMIVAEALARTGVERLQLLDFDTLKEHNQDRTLYATDRNVLLGRSKVEIAARALRRSATARDFQVEADELSVCEEEGYHRALDCDVLFSCVDRPWARSVLNMIAYAHLIPVIDGGILVSRTTHGTLRGADWKAHVAGSGHRCLKCLGQYDPGLVAADRAGDLDDPRYLASLPGDHPLRANENVFAFSAAVASLELLQWLMLVVAPLGLGPPGPQNYHLMTGDLELGRVVCDDDCSFPGYIATGAVHHPGTGDHRAAHIARESRAAK